MKRIIIIGDASSTNLGDPILTSCCSYIVRHILEDKSVPVDLFDIAGRKSKRNVEIPLISQPISLEKTRVFSKLRSFQEDIKTLCKWYISGKKKFRKSLLQGLMEDTIFVIAGGALISSSLFYALRLREVVSIASKKRGKVIFNAVGIERTIHNFGFVKYVVPDFLKNKAIVAFSTRDHVEEMPYLTTRQEFYKLVPDAGLFASDAYNIFKCQSSKIVGISVISYQAYQSVAANEKEAERVTPTLLIKFWTSIIDKLQKQGFDFRIVTNGGIADYNMALMLAESLNLDKQKYLLPLAQTPEQLISQLSQFSFVIAHRLHACIISTSLKIPLIPVKWSDKILVFAKMIDNENSIWPSENFDPLPFICDTSFKEECINSLKASSIEFLKKSLEC